MGMATPSLRMPEGTPHKEAWAVAQYLKRSTREDFVAHSAAQYRDRDEPYQMRDGAAALR